MFFGKKRSASSQDLIGCWVIDPKDIEAKKLYGNIKMTFDGQGNLTYEINEDGQLQIIKLAYQIDGKFIITDQPSYPKKEVTEFILDNNKLFLIQGDQKSTYLKLNDSHVKKE